VPSRSFNEGWRERPYALFCVGIFLFTTKVPAYRQAGKKLQNYKSTKMDKVIYKELSYEIIGAVFEVFKELGYGFKERYYEDAIAKEFKNRKINFRRQLPYKLKYKGEIIGNYIFDFLVEDKIIVELKQGDYFSKNNINQALQYLKSANLKLAILVNITSNGVKFKRILNIM